MKKQNLTKFALSLVCAAVLSACGGSDNAAPTTTAPTAEEAAAAEAAAKKAANIKALTEAATKAGLSAEDAAKFAAANEALDAAKEAEVAAAIAKFQAEQKKASWAKAANGATSAPGYKLVQKVESDFTLMEAAASGNNVSGIAQRMGVQDPNRRLDNIVVAQPKQGVLKDSQGDVNAIYLEEFDFSTGSATTPTAGATVTAALTKSVTGGTIDGNQKTAGTTAATKDNVQTLGYIQLKNLYINEATRNLTADPAVAAGLARPNTDWSYNLVGASTPYTRTANEGEKTGTVLLFQKGRADYTETAGYEVLGTGTVMALENAAADAGLDASNKAAFKNGDKTAKTGYRIAGTVAEVYGYRTFADASKIAVTAKDRGDYANTPNLPLVGYVKAADRASGTTLAGVEYKGAQLKHVQYGRVTSSLHADDIEAMKMGVRKDTRVASYGLYGNEGTENNYFYRGVDSTNSEDLAKVLEGAKAQGKLTYEGHAVTYGLVKDPRTADGGIPTALSGAAADFFSGTHVNATINVADNSVEGSLFNRFTTPQVDKFTKADLVTFKGQLGTDGNIVGESALAYATDKNNKEGTFNATLYGSDASEMGGIVASKKADADQWGAVFGATKGSSSGIRESVDGSTAGK